MSKEYELLKKSYNYAERLRVAREKSGKSMEEIAALLGMTFESYRDLEDYEDEIMKCISIQELILLCKALKIKPREFFSSESHHQSEPIDFSDLLDNLREYLCIHHMTVSQFENEAGWEIEPLLKNPAELFGERYNVEALKDICDAIGVDWVRALPEVSF